MSNKSLKNIFGLIGGSSSGSGGSETVCPNGHPMDPSWTRCPRCDAESRANERSSEASASHTFDDPDSRSPNMSSRQQTVIPGGPSSDASATRRDSGYDSGYDSAAPGTSGNPRRARDRKVTGVLVSFTWDRCGDLFALHEGRNVIGKGTVESEGGRPCDIQLSVDATMSNEHAVILCRAGRYELFDNRSTNGTYADDQFVESAGVMLRDGACIKTGETVWLFRKIESDEAGAHQAPAHGPSHGPSHRDEPQKPSREPQDWDEPRRPPRDDSRVS